MAKRKKKLQPLDTATVDKIDSALSAVRKEMIRATQLHGGFRNGHEGYGILQEEVDELFDDIKANRKKRAKVEAVQVAATAARFLVCL